MKPDEWNPTKIHMPNNLVENSKGLAPMSMPVHNERSSGSGVRVAMYGNMCNCLYQMAKTIRRHSAVDVHLFLDQNHESQMRPECDDPKLKDNYPDWIHVGNYCSPKHLAMPFLSPLVTEMNNFENVVLCENGPIFAPFLQGKKAFFVGGGDLTMFPFFKRRYLFRRIPIVDKIGAFVRGYWQRRGIKCVDEIWSQAFEPFKKAQKLLGVENRVSPTYFPIPIDTDLFSNETSVSAGHPLSKQITEIKSRFSFTIFHPSRFMVDDSKYMIETGQWKNNGLLLAGFKQFVERNCVERPGLILVRKSGHDADRERIEKLIDDLGIEPFVYWLQPSNTSESKRRHQQIPREQLAAIYKTCDCTADDFGVGWFGSIVLEGLSCGKPVLNKIDETAMKQMYPYHPILSVSTADEIASTLCHLATDKDFYNDVCIRSYSWIRKHHSLQTAGSTYVSNILRFCNDDQN